MHYWDLDYAFLGGELSNLIGELEEERLNTPDNAPPSMSPGPSTENAAKIKIVSTEAFE